MLTQVAHVASARKSLLLAIAHHDEITIAKFVILDQGRSKTELTVRHR